MREAERVRPYGVGVGLAAHLRRERVEVAGVRLERVFREGAFDAKVIEVGVDPALEVHLGA